MNVQVNLISLAAALLVWNYAFPRQKSRIVDVLNTIPAFGEFKKKLARDAVTSALQVAALYAVAEQIRKRI